MSAKNSTKRTKARASSRKLTATKPAEPCPQLGDFVLVEWNDANSAPRWSPAYETSVALASIVSSGFLVAKEADRLTLSGDLDRTSGNVARLVSIPTGGISRTRVLGRGVAEEGFFLQSDLQALAVKTAKNIRV